MVSAVPDRLAFRFCVCGKAVRSCVPVPAVSGGHRDLCADHCRCKDACPANIVLKMCV